MRVLAIDTATERCSVALLVNDVVIERSSDTARGHADEVLPMVESVLREAAVGLRDCDGIAYGRGPGAFTGVRIAVGVVQGLAFGAQRLTVGVSNLAAVAQQVARSADAADARILVCMDARMGEVYWAVFQYNATSGLVSADGPEQVTAPQLVVASKVAAVAGTGLRAYPDLASRFAPARMHGDVLPRAREIALLGADALRAGRGAPASEAQPVYLREQVATPRAM